MGSGAPLSYSFSDLQDLSGAIGKAETNVEGIRQDIRKASGTLAAHWHSDKAVGNWSSVQGRWEKACDGLHTALHQLSQKVLLSSTEMEQTEAKNAGLFAGE